MEESSAAVDAAADLGLRVYLGPAYRSGNSYERNDGSIALYFDEERGFAGLCAAERHCQQFEGRAGGLIKTMLTPDRMVTSTDVSAEFSRWTLHWSFSQVAGGGGAIGSGPMR